MRIIYFGSPDFAVKPLEKLIEKGYEIVAVVTNKDKPVGRKQILTPTAVKTCAISNGLKVLEYKSVRKEGVEDIKALKPDIMVTCAFGQILSEELLSIPKMTLNIHGSLLPKYRGAAPIQWSVINGDKQTGITIMKTDAGIDTGDIMFSQSIDIGLNETAGEVFDRLSYLGAECIIKALEMVEKGEYAFLKQDESKASYVKMLSKEDGLLSFDDSAYMVHKKVMGLNPWPTAYVIFKGEPLKIHKTEIVEGNGKVGQILKADKELVVACKDGAIKILEIPKAGSKKMPAKDFLLGNKLEVGSILGDN